MAGGVSVNGTGFQADYRGALFWPERSLLAVADLHLEKGSSYARSAQFLPPYDTAATLAKLEECLDQFCPARVVCLGDSFHDGEGPARMSAEARQRLAEMMRGRDWVWIAGNHDPAPPEELGGRVLEELVEGGIVFRHQALERAAPGELSGHFHPKATLRRRGRSISLRCFVGDGTRLILPSFGAYTGGLDVSAPQIRGLFSRPPQLWLLGRERVYRYREADLTKA
ncbi:MAG: ligase-associated DNA damage response endonuclease PdeM [Rhodovibrionaceae bacterium]